MLKRAAFCILAGSILVAGCEMPEAGTYEPQEAAETARPAPEPASVLPIVGCWTKTTPGVVVTESINGDGTCSESVVTDPAIAGPPGASASGTWTASGGDALTFAYPAPIGTLLCTYAIMGDTLTMTCPYMHGPQFYQRTTCN